MRGQRPARRRLGAAGARIEAARRRDRPARQRRPAAGRRPRRPGRRRRSAAGGPLQRRRRKPAAGKRAGRSERAGSRRQPADPQTDRAGQQNHPRASSTPATSSSPLSTAPRRPRARRSAKRSTSIAAARRRRCWSSPTTRFNTPGSIRLNKQLTRRPPSWPRTSGLTTGVAGGAAQLNDYSRVTRERMPWIIVGDHHRHLPGPDRGPAGAAAGGDRGRPQPAHGRRSPSGS